MEAASTLFTAGTGLYTPREAALYARLHPSMLTRWLYGNKSGERVVTPQLDGEERVVTFLDFVQTLAIRSIRQQHHISLDKIRTAIDQAENVYGVRWPLARKHTTYLLGRDIQIVPEAGGSPIQVTGKGSGQLSLRSIVELHLRDLGWDAEGLARSYRAFTWNNREVLMDPARHFGEPLIPSCDYSARALVEAAETEGSIEAAAEAYGVAPEDVEIACRYFDHLQLPLAA
jgi:uncharacterized protein (DUF433 family)